MAVKDWDTSSIEWHWFCFLNYWYDCVYADGLDGWENEGGH